MESRWFSLISEIDYNKFFNRMQLQATKVKLNYYSGEKCKPIGVLQDVKITYGSISRRGNLYLIRTAGKPLIERDG